MPEPRPWILAGPVGALARMAPLAQAHAGERPVELVIWPPRPGQADRSALPTRLVGAEAALVIGDSRMGPRRALPGVFATGSVRPIPVGWLPDDPARLEHYAAAAAQALHARRGPASGQRDVVWLGERSDRARALVDELEILAAFAPRCTARRWTAERIGRSDLLAGLRLGLGLAVYVGHGLPGRWFGYGGVDAESLGACPGAALGAVVSLSCHGATRRGARPSFAEELVLSGACAGALAAVGQTLHVANANLAKRLAKALCCPEAPVLHLADLLRRTRARGSSLARYRIIGDPLAPLTSFPSAQARAAAVFAPAPGAALPPLPRESWPARAGH